MQFVTEKEVEEIKVRRQKEWEKVRRPDQPLGKLKIYCLTRLNYKIVKISLFLACRTTGGRARQQNAVREAKGTARQKAGGV